MGLAAGTMLTPQLRLMRRLGQGSMGEVWAALPLPWNATVAVKLIRAHSTPEQEQRFLAEASGLASLWSPHLVRIYDIGRYRPPGARGTEGPYIVMERLDGEDLRTRIEREGPLDPPVVALMIDQVCRALGAAHAAGVIHRNISRPTSSSTGTPRRAWSRSSTLAWRSSP
ncbi:MAG: protein kinase [Myxococcota bacterium]